MAGNENVEVVRRAYESFNRWAASPGAESVGNPEVRLLLDPDVEFHTYPDSPEAGIGGVGEKEGLAR